MYKTMRGRLIRWRRKEENLIHHLNFGEWMYCGEADQAWGLEEFLELPGAVPVKIEEMWFFRDPRGRYHKSIRACFSDFRLKRSAREGNVDHLDRMLAALSAIDDGLHKSDPERMIDDVFDGSRGYFEDYMAYLELEVIIATEGRAIADFELTTEGKSILRMLKMTAPDSDVDYSPHATMLRLMENHPDRVGYRFKDIDW